MGVSPHVGNKLPSSLDLKEAPSQASRTYRGKRAIATITIPSIFGSKCFRSKKHSAGNASGATMILLGRHRDDHLDVPNTWALNTLHPEHDRKEYPRHHKK